MKKIFIFSIPLIFFGIFVLLFQSNKTEIIKTSKEDIEIKVFFSPDDDIKSELIKLIENEKSFIFCAMFRLTEKEITKALLDATLRGIKIVALVDSEGLSGSYSKVIHLFKEGVPLYIFPSIEKSDLDEERKEKPLSQKNGLMHNKFFIFESQKTVFTGSYNFTRAAQEINQENVLIIKNEKIFNLYKNHFEKICSRSTLLGLS